MSVVFLNDQFLDHDKAFINIGDRGFQFGDGIYEVILFENNKLIDFDDHIKRLFTSAAKIDLKIDKTAKEFQKIFLELFAKNNLKSGSVYLQITRGASPMRIQDFPDNYQITINAIANKTKDIAQADLENGMKAITAQDIRWNRCDIKSISLLGATMLKEKAKKAQSVEAILLKDGFVTEGSFSNVFIVNNNNQIITRNADEKILEGITRNRIIILAKENNLEIIERKFDESELLNANEVFLTSSTLKIRPISKINNQIIGSGQSGEVSKKLIKIYNNYCLS